VAMVTMMIARPEGLWPSRQIRREIASEDEVPEPSLAATTRSG
jgi:hypothetical protein